MPAITVDAFLEALDLPSEHPYAGPQDGLREDEERERSVLGNSSGPGECDDYSWARRKLGHGDVADGACLRPRVAARHRYRANGPDRVDGVGNLLQGIRPCLVPVLQLNVLLWAPLVILFCLVKIYVPSGAPLRGLGTSRSSGTLSGEKDSRIQQVSYFAAVSSLPSFIPSLLRAVHDKQKTQSSGPSRNSSFERPSLLLSLFLNAISAMANSSGAFSIEEKGEEKTSHPSKYGPRCEEADGGRTGLPFLFNGVRSFESLLLMLSLFSNAVSSMANFSAAFSIEETREEKTSHPSERGTKREEADGGYEERHPSIGNASNRSRGSFLFTNEWGAYLIALLFTSVVMNDAMYAMAFPQSNLVALHVFVVYLALKRYGSRVALATALPITAMAFYVMVTRDLDLPTIEPGLYYDETNPLVSEAVRIWPEDKRAYDDGRGTQWMITGDTRTGLPFLFNKVPKQDFVRRWVPLPEEREAVILDIAFPESMTIDDDKRVFIVLHGINGNSNEGYVLDFIHRQVSQGNIAAVMVTRGLGDSTVLGENIPHFARTSDVGAAIQALRKAVDAVSPAGGLLLAGVGYSMGAITLANYVARPGPADLDVAIAFSGALDTTRQATYERSARLWQPFIAKAMRDTLFGRYSRQIARRLDQGQIEEAMRAENMVELDRAFFVPYNGFGSLNGYHRRMVALGDYDVNGYGGRIANVSVPLLCVQSLDDPIGHWGTYRDPAAVAASGGGHVAVLLTRTGGHVGWPLGWRPAAEGWRWMGDVAGSFAEAVGQARRGR